MKCKACGKELRAGSKKCPYCGADVSVTGMHAGDEFQWNVQDFPKAGKKQNKKTDFSIDWSSGKILERNSGKMYVQAENMWKEPEGWDEPEGDSQMFRFDRKHEDLQREVDRQVEHIADTTPQAAKKAPSSMDLFVLPSQMEMEDLTIPQRPEESEAAAFEEVDLSSEKDVREEMESSEVLSDTAVPEAENTRAEDAEERKPETRAEEPADAEEPAAELPEKPSQAASQQMAKFFSRTMDLQNELPVDDMKEMAVDENSEEDISPGYTAEEEARVMADFQKLIDAEKNLSENLDRVTYLSDQEEAEERKAERRREDLQSVPEFSFRSLEEEYEKYRRDHGIEKKPGLSRETVSSNDDAKKEDHPAASAQGELTPSRERQSEPRTNRKKPREVNIKINEPSGTEYTVKTQEVGLFHTEGSETRRVDLDEIKNAARGVQVSVEVNGGNGNSSVEVTRRHDGATVVRTLENDDTEAHEYGVAGTSVEPNAVIPQEVPEEPELNDEDALTGESFWSQTEAASRMTITDIFGPEAQKFKEEWEKNSDSDLEDSMILDIRPEDIALTDDQTQAIRTVSPDDNPEGTLDLNNTIPFDKDELLKIEEAAREAEEAEGTQTESAEEGAADETAEQTTDASQETPETEEAQTEEMTEHSDPEGTGEGEAGTEDAAAEAEEPVTAEQGTEDAEPAAAQEDAAESSGAEPKQYEDLTTMLPVDEIKQMEENSEEAPEQPIYEFVYEDHEKTEEPLPDEPVEEKSGQPAEADNKDEQKAAAKVKEFFAKKREERDARRNQKQSSKPAETGQAKPQDRSSLIMKVIIAVLVALIVIEFTVIGVKVLAPDSQASIFINRIESAIISQETGPSQTHALADPAGEAPYE